MGDRALVSGLRRVAGIEPRVLPMQDVGPVSHAGVVLISFSS